MKKTMVIGYGNTLRRDDGAGVAAAKKIARGCPGASVMTAGGLYPEMAEELSGCDMALFLDASVRTSGVSVTRILPGESFSDGAAHALSPAEILGLCSTLYGHAPEEAMLVEIPAFECGFGETMSEGTLRMVDCCVQLISELLAGETTPEILRYISPGPAAD